MDRFGLAGALRGGLVNPNCGRTRMTQWPDLHGNTPQRRMLSLSNGEHDGESARCGR
jgi:hypothetical protein